MATMMRRKWLVVSSLFLAIALAGLAFESVSAQETQQHDRDRALVRFGELEAAGSGVANLRGGFELRGTMGAGALVVRGAAEVKLDGFDARYRLPGGAWVYLGVRGECRVEGDRIGVTVIGSDVHFTAEGRGVARMIGQGWYTVDGGERTAWLPE